MLDLLPHVLNGLTLGLLFALIAPCVAGIAGIAVEVCMRRTYGKDPLYGLLLTFGAAMVIEEGIRLTWGTRDHVLPLPPDA